MKTIEMLPQPDDTSCGPTALHAIYKYYGLDIPLNTVISELEGYSTLEGTYDAMIGVDALKRGFQVNIFVYNLRIFDPSWKYDESITEKLYTMKARLSDPRLIKSVEWFIRFSEMGGHIVISSPLINALTAEHPVICGLSATHLYNCRRENPITNEYDEFGSPVGHYVVTDAHFGDTSVPIYDPYGDRSRIRKIEYIMPINAVIESIMLGTLTYDGSVIEIY